ncbi:MAG: hypothetical protein ACU841_02790 [Gammaproteobacteria bacterium]
MNVKILIFLLMMSSVNTAAAIESPYVSGGYIVDIMIYRPLGLVTTVVGTALYIGISPLTALAAISPPHDAFAKAADVLIMKPAGFTFNRPLGVYYVDADGRYRRPE